MLSGHVQYAKGYAEETIGNATGSTEWQESGKKDAQAGIDEMKVRWCCSNTFPHASPLTDCSFALLLCCTVQWDHVLTAWDTQAASQQKTSEPAPSGIGGRVEELAGKATGCEGMESEGKERQAKAS